MRNLEYCKLYSFLLFLLRDPLPKQISNYVYCRFVEIHNFPVVPSLKEHDISRINMINIQNSLDGHLSMAVRSVYIEMKNYREKKENLPAVIRSLQQLSIKLPNLI